MLNLKQESMAIENGAMLINVWGTNAGHTHQVRDTTDGGERRTFREKKPIIQNIGLAKR